MNVQEAIKDIKENVQPSVGGKSLAMAIQSLEMQIPKKPIYSDFDDNGNDEIIPYKAVCPTCGYEFEFGTWNEEENHHCRCGQKLDWEGGATDE